MAIAIYSILTLAAIVIGILIAERHFTYNDTINRIKSGRNKRREYDHDNPDTFYED